MGQTSTCQRVVPCQRVFEGVCEGAPNDAAPIKAYPLAGEPELPAPGEQFGARLEMQSLDDHRFALASQQSPLCVACDGVGCGLCREKKLPSDSTQASRKEAPCPEQGSAGALARLLTLSSGDDAHSVTLNLSQRGISLRQLVSLYSDLRALGICQDGAKTWEVVRNVIIPATAPECCSFMESEFMRRRGGPHLPHKLVSHWWGADFRDTLVCMVMDACDMSAESVQTSIDAPCPLKTLEQVAGLFSLRTVYWFCIFAVNQHRSICGTDYNPCACGSQQFSPGDPRCEMDKFDRVMAQIPGGILVALGPDLGALRRVWCLAEIGVALALGQPISFSVARKLPESLPSTCFVPRVQDCEASRGADRERILGKIERAVGFASFNAQIRTLLTMSGPGVSGYRIWRVEQEPAPWRDLQSRFFQELSANERKSWRKKEIAAFDRDRFSRAIQDPARFEFRYQGMGAHQVHAIGLPILWEHAKRKFSRLTLEFDGDALPGMSVYETIGPGPKLFGVIQHPDGARIFYHDYGIWSQYSPATQVPLDDS